MIDSVCFLFSTVLKRWLIAFKKPHWHSLINIKEPVSDPNTTFKTKKLLLRTSFPIVRCYCSSFKVHLGKGMQESKGITKCTREKKNNLSQVFPLVPNQKYSPDLNSLRVTIYWIPRQKLLLLNIVYNTSNNLQLCFSNKIFRFQHIITMAEGYNFCVDYDLQPIGMENTTDGHVEFIKLVDGLCWSDIPEDTII